MTGPREDWRPPFCPDPTGCAPLIHPLTDGDNLTLDQRGFAVFCFGRLAEPLTWTFDGVEHVETLSTCQSSPIGLRCSGLTGRQSRPHMKARPAVAEPLTPEVRIARLLTENWTAIRQGSVTPLHVAKAITATLDAARAAAPSGEVDAFLQWERRPPAPDPVAGLRPMDATALLDMADRHSVNDLEDGNIRVEAGTWDELLRFVDYHGRAALLDANRQDGPGE